MNHFDGAGPLTLCGLAKNLMFYIRGLFKVSLFVAVFFRSYLLPFCSYKNQRKRYLQPLGSLWSVFKKLFWYKVGLVYIYGSQCCGSGMISSWVPNPTKFHSGSRIRDLDPRSYYIRKKGKFLKLLPKLF
jgi:hypothetical protein